MKILLQDYVDKRNSRRDRMQFLSACNLAKSLEFHHLNIYDIPGSSVECGYAASRVAAFGPYYPLLVVLFSKGSSKDMPKPLLVTHTIKSHGVQLVRLHVHDWLILALVMVLEFVLSEVVPPFHRFIGREVMVDLKYPLTLLDFTCMYWFPRNSLSSEHSLCHVAFIIGILVPFVFIFVYYIIRRNVYDFHQATLGLLFAVFFTGVITNAIKDAVGRPRRLGLISSGGVSLMERM
ncbi:hypothetical protein EJ110_NYTH28268 [Nymphaea thermarum]|nr:hypothetical protein EJ110_NYTH28268 [Nymphaea thermarum]